MAKLKIEREIVGVVLTNWAWDSKIMPKEVKVSKDCRSIFLKEEDYVFRTVFGEVGFMEGIHYWEIVADANSEHELKIGISGTNEIN